MKTFLKAYWKDIVMVNYEIDTSVLLPYLPKGVEIDTYNNKTFVSLVGFQFLYSKLFGMPIPYFGSFDKVNLRFYVKRNEGNGVKRGVVFISEIVPFKIVSFLANLSYKEHYSYAKMNSKCAVIDENKLLEYHWQKNKNDYSIKGNFNKAFQPIENNSLEEFIYEHYYGYTKVNEYETWEYKVNHPRWQLNTIKVFEINCDFKEMYGDDFEFLNHQKPYSVYNAVGSEVSINWRINKLKFEK